MTPLLEVVGITKHFGGLYALAGLDLHVDEGEIVSVIGPNGAGKSTLFNVVTGLYEPDEGEVRFQAESIVGFRPNQITKLGVARTFQNVHLFPNMTVLENAMVGRHTRTLAGPLGAIVRTGNFRREEQKTVDEALRWLRFVNLEEHANLRLESGLHAADVVLSYECRYAG